MAIGHARPHRGTGSAYGNGQSRRRNAVRTNVERAWSFRRFLDQFGAVGRAKGEGYDPAMFAGMSDAELSQTRAMLLERALAGDTVDLDGLRHLGGTDVVAALRAALAATDAHGAPWQIKARDTMYALTGEMAVLLPLLLVIDSRDAATRERAAQLLARTKLPSAMAEPIAARLCRWHSHAVRLPLAIAWLTTQGLPTYEPQSFTAHLPLVRRILDCWPWQRRRVLADLAGALGRA